MNRLRVAILRPTLGQGGADRVTLTLLQELDRARFGLELLLIHRRGDLLDQVPSDVEVVGLGGGNIFSAVPRLRRRLREHPPDVLLSTSSGTNLTACRATRGLDPGPGLVLSERNTLERARGSWRQRILRIAKRREYRRADAVIAVSEALGAEIVQQLRVEPSRVHVIYNPVLNRSQVIPTPSDSELRPGRRPQVLAAGRLVPEKGFDVLLEAMAMFPIPERPELVILGEGPERERLEALAARLGLADLQLPGFVDDPEAWMSTSDVFVLASRFEGLPGVLIQAMACGCAVVATDCPTGPSEIVTDGRDGVLVPVADAEAMFEAIRSLIDRPDLRSRLGSAARESVRRRFRSDVAVPSYAEVLRTAAGAP